MLTDTIPGLVCAASNPAGIERIYELKQRNPAKPLTFMISSQEQLSSLGVEANDELRRAIDKYWPGPVSLILPVTSPKESKHLHRGLESLAVRQTADEQLIGLLEQTGLLASSTANVEDQPASLSVNEAIKYFEDEIQTYVGHPPIDEDRPSKLVHIERDGSETVLRG